MALIQHSSLGFARERSSAGSKDPERHDRGKDKHGEDRKEGEDTRDN